MTTRQYRILCSLAMMMGLLGAEAQPVAGVPRLVVSVVVDQLRSDYLEAFAPLYGEDGFRRLMREARVYRQAEYPFAQPERASAVACLATGATPYVNGIVGQRWFSRQTLQPQFCVGTGTPESLAVTTIGDELKLSTGGRALVFSVAPDIDAAVLAAGHAADGAYWLDDDNGQWATSAYYLRPAWLGKYNSDDHAGRSIDKMAWTPVDDRRTDIPFLPLDDDNRYFRHTFRGDRAFRLFKTSGMVNEEVTEFVAHCLEHTELGRDDVADYLAVTYYAGTFDHRSVAAASAELQDTYVRLDLQLGRLMQEVERRVGAGRVMFVVTGTGRSDAEVADADLKRYRIPTGEFNLTRAQGLLNMYLSALYGQAQYIEGSLGNQLYFDHKGIEQRNLILSEVLERSAQFLMQLSGVRDVYTAERLTQRAWSTSVAALREGYHIQRSGDIVVQVLPGWTLVNEHTGERREVRDGYVPFPLYLFGVGILPDVVAEPVTVERVAPTVARCLRIRAPNGCAASPLVGVR